MPYENTASVLPHTKRFIGNLIKNFDFSVPNTEGINLNSFRKRKETEYQNLQKLKNSPTHIPKDQTKKVELGNGVIIELNGVKKEIMIDGYKVGPNPVLISIYSPLAKAILNKKVDYATTFLNPSGQTCSVKIIEIIAYTQAKMKFFPKQKFA